MSAEGEWIAWDNWSARPEPEGIGAKLLVILATTSPPTRSLTFDSWFGGPLAISSKAEHLALIKGVTGQKQPYSLVVADTAAARVEHDVTDLVTRFPLARAVRLGLSGSGNRLVVGSAEWFTVIDLPSRKSVYEARGRYPSLSPDGEFLAFVDQDRRVFLRALSTRSGRILRGRSGSVDGIGAWSPDGRYLLAGVSGTLSLSKKLVAIDSRTNRVVDLMPLGDLSGDKCVWVKKSFLSSSSTLG